MPHAPILTLLLAALALTACSGSNNAGGPEIPAPDASIASPCQRPESMLGAGDWEVISGRIGDALIECGAEKAALVEYISAMRETLAR